MSRPDPFFPTLDISIADSEAIQPTARFGQDHQVAVDLTRDVMVFGDGGDQQEPTEPMSARGELSPVFLADRWQAPSAPFQLRVQKHHRNQCACGRTCTDSGVGCTGTGMARHAAFSEAWCAWISTKRGQIVGLDGRLEWVPDRLAELLRHYGIPAGSVAVWNDGEEFATATGLANTRAGIEATTDTLFLIGSNTKVYTTTLVMQLVERGQVDLDTPVRQYLPELELSDSDATAAVTVRHLLTHTSGITGDYFPDFGRGDDAVERLVASLNDVEMLHEPGEMFSYCNSGFILAGRMIERLTGRTWDDVLWSELLEPLGSRNFATLPEEALLHRTAVGHLPDPKSGEMIPGQMWPEVRSGGPAGFTPYATARDLVLFGRLHLNGGVAPNGNRIISEERARDMQNPHVQVTPSGPCDGDGWGLGWGRYRYSEGERVVGHNGGSAALLRVLPDRNFAVASLTNASNGMYVGHHIIDAVVNELFGIRIPATIDATSHPDALEPYEGMYHHHNRQRMVTANRGALQTTMRDNPDKPATLEPTHAEKFLVHTPGIDVPARASILKPNSDGRYTCFHVGGRAHVRRDESGSQAS